MCQQRLRCHWLCGGCAVVRRFTLFRQISLHHHRRRLLTARYPTLSSRPHIVLWGRISLRARYSMCESVNQIRTLKSRAKRTLPNLNCNWGYNLQVLAPTNVNFILLYYLLQMWHHIDAQRPRFLIYVWDFIDFNSFGLWYNTNRLCLSFKRPRCHEWHV